MARVLVAVTLMSLACISGPKKDQTAAINPKLAQVMDWPAVQDPVWVSDSKLYVYSARIIADRRVVGVFETTIDPTTLAYVSSVPYEFPHDVWTLRYDTATQKLLVSYAEGQGFKASSLSFPNQQLVEELLVDVDWQPWAVSAWPGRHGFVFYGQRPNDQLQGFYWRHPDGHGGQSDSLLHAVALTHFAAEGTAVSSDGHFLFFSQGDRQVTFYQLDLSQPSSGPVVLLTRAGGKGGIFPNPVDPELVLLNYSFGGDQTNRPQSHIELFDLRTLGATDLNVRTDRFLARFIFNDHPWWSPNGRNFVFSAGSFDGEGGRSPVLLWVYREVP